MVNCVLCSEEGALLSNLCVNDCKKTVKEGE